MQLETVEICEKKFGDNDRDLLSNMTELARTYYDQGRIDAAEGLQVKVLAAPELGQGHDHGLTLRCMHYLSDTRGQLAGMQDELDKAEGLLAWVLEGH